MPQDQLSKPSWNGATNGRRHRHPHQRAHRLMRLLIVIILTTGFQYKGYAGIPLTNNWYSKSTGYLNDLATWGSNPDGSGGSPSDFSNGNFYIVNNPSPTINAIWAPTANVAVGDGTSAVNFTIPSGFAYTGSPIYVTTGATLAIANTTLPAIGGLSTNSTVAYIATTAQSIANISYSNLTIGNGSASLTYTPSANLTVNGILTVNANAVLNLGTNTLSGTVSSTAGAGMITTQNTSATPVPSGITWSGTVRYNATTGSQTVAYGTYNNLTIGGTSGTWSASNSTIAINGTLNISSDCNFNMGTSMLVGTPTISGSSFGVLLTQNTSSTPLPSGRYWATMVKYAASSGGQTVVKGSYTWLELNGSGTFTAADTINIVSQIKLTGYAKLQMGTNIITGSLMSSAGGEILTQNTSSTPLPANRMWSSTTVRYNASSGQTVVGGQYYDLYVSASGMASGNINIDGRLYISGMLDMGTNRLSFLSPGFQNFSGTLRTQNTSSNPIPAGLNLSSLTMIYDAPTGGQSVVSGTFGDVQIKNTSGTNSATGNLTASSLTVETGARLDMGTYSLYCGYNTVKGTLATAASNGLQASALYSNTAGTLEFNGTGIQTLPASSITCNLFINNSFGITLAGDVTIFGRTTTTGPIRLGNYRIATFSNILGMSATNRFICNGNSSLTFLTPVNFGPIYFDQTTDGTTNKLSNLLLDCSGGTVTLGNKLAVNSLSLNGGRLKTGTNDFVFTTLSNGTLGTATHIEANTGGRVRKIMTANGTAFFPIGDSIKYTPIALTVSGSGYANANIGVTVSASKHPSNTSTDNFLSRYWNVTTTGITAPSVVVDSARYAGADVTGNEASVRAAKYAAGAWTRYSAPANSKLATTAITNTSFDISGIEGVITNVTIGNTTICAGKTHTLTATPSAGDDPFIYQWYGPGATLGTNANQGVTPSVTTVYTVVVTGASLSATQATATVTVNAAPAITAIGNNGPVCNGSQLSLHSTVTGGATPYAFSWKGPDGYTSTDEDATVTTTAGFSAAGTYTLTVNGNDGCAAPGSNTTTAVILSKPAITAIGATAPACQGSPLSLHSTVSGGTLPYTYSWSGPNTFTATNEAPTVTATATSAANGSYALAVTDANGCSATGTNTTAVIVFASPAITAIGNNGPVCEGSALTLQSTLSGGAMPYSYSWTGPNGFTATTEDPSVATMADVNVAGTYVLGITDANGCAATGTNSTGVAVRTRPAIFAIGNNGPVCEGGVLSLQSTVTNGAAPYSYSWTGPNSFTSTNEDPTVIANATTSQAGTYTLGVTDNNGCTATGVNTTIAAIVARPAINAIGSNGPVCEGSPLLLQTTVTGGLAPYIYSWTGPNSFTSTNEDPTVTTTADADAAGTYMLAVTDGNGCVATGVNTTLAVIVARPAITAVGNNGPVCAGSTLSLHSTVTGGATPYAYTWTGANGFTSTIEDPTVSVAATAAASGMYSLAVIDRNGCAGTGANTTAVAVNAAPTIVAVGNNGPVCAGSPLSVHSTVSGGTAPYTYSWSGPGGFSSTGEDPAVTSTAALISAGIYTLSVVDNKGCIAAGVNHTTAIVNPLPAISYIGNSAPVCENNTLSLESTVSGGSGVYSYYWTGPKGFTSTIEDPVVSTAVSANASGTYVLGVVDNYGCAATGTNTTVVTVHSSSAIAGDNSVAFGQTITLSNAITGGTWSASAPWITNVNSTAGSVKGVSAGTGTVSYTNPNGCVETQTVTVYSSINACVGQNITLTPSGPGGTWTSSNGSIATVNLNTGVVGGVSPGRTTMIYRLPGGAISTTTVIVNPLSQITSATPKICVGQVLAMTNTTGTGSWYSDNALLATVSSTGNVTGLAGGIATIYFTPSGGCAAQKTVTVAPVAAITGSPLVCAGQTTELSASLGGGVWTTNAAAVATITPLGVVTGVAASMGRITYTTTGGCVSVMTITVRPLSPTTGPNTCCQWQTTTLTNTTAGGGAWTSSNTYSAVVSNMGVVSGTGGGSATISFTTPQGCVATRAVSVNGVTPITGTMTVCAGQNVQLTNSTAGGIWYASSGALATVTGTGTVYGVAAGAPRISYILPSGCWTQVTVTVNALNPTSGGTMSICASNNMTLINTTPGGGVWSSTNTSAATVSSAGFVKGTGAGSANILFTTTNGCVFTRPVTVNACRIAGEETGTVKEVAEVSHSMQLFPNPNSGTFTLKGSIALEADAEVIIDVVNMLGQTIYSSTLKTEQGSVNQPINLGSTLASGTYMLTLRSGDVRQVYRFVVSR